MPTAPKLFAGLILAAAVYVASMAFWDDYRPGLTWGNLYIAGAVMGFWGGWVIVGKRMGRGLMAGMGAGLLGAFGATFWGLFFLCGFRMFERTQTFRYADVEAAFFYLIDQFILFWKIIATSESGIVLVVGGIIAGLVAEFVHKISSRRKLD